jgi:hypothetical protein
LFSPVVGLRGRQVAWRLPRARSPDPLDGHDYGPPLGETPGRDQEPYLNNSRDKRGRRRRGHGPNGVTARHHIPLTPEGVPATAPDAPPTSGVVIVSDESRALYPWLPGRVIAWSVWRGPAHVRVQIDQHGNAQQLGVRPVLTRVR